MSAPKELVTLAAALHELARLAAPTTSPALSDVSVSHEHPDPTGEHVVDGGYWRRRYRKRLAETLELADKIRDDIEERDTRALRWRCKCGAYGHADGKFCSRCGAARSQAS